MKQTITIILGIIMALPLVFAMYGGESEVRVFTFETDNCTIVPNVSEGINFTFNGNNVLVEPAINFVGAFNITCYNWLTKEEETQTSGGFRATIRSSPVKLNKVAANETIDNETIDEKDYYSDEPITYEPVDEVKSKSKWIIGGVVLILLIIYFAFYWIVK